ncbi:NAD binding Rossmann fold oxidoreductase [Daedaleopsis nitida]|nr:NAD binding Rossmann fold oxidoreductase [Daedaleopsis nitida]
MAILLQFTTFVTQYLYGAQNNIPKEENALRIGILSTANINSAALINPAKSHGGVIVSAVASRNLEQAQKYAEEYGIPKAYGSYEELLKEPGIDAVYISLPNGMHGTWAKKALDAGKHVLLEKPFTANAEEARSLVDFAKQKNLVLVEAFHWQFHPAAHSLKALIGSGQYGPILRTYATMTTPKGSIPRSDIRWQYALAGGSLMDMTYVISSTRYFLGADTPREVAEAKARPSPQDRRVDDAMEATDMWRPNLFGIIPRAWEAPSIEIETEHAKIYFYNFMMPHLYHYITIYDKRTKQTTTKKFYSGGPQWGQRGETWWSTYRYQLEAFVDKVRGREPVHWVTFESSIAQMETIDMVYEKSGLGKRFLTPENANS